MKWNRESKWGDWNGRQRIDDMKGKGERRVVEKNGMMWKKRTGGDDRSGR